MEYNENIGEGHDWEVEQQMDEEETVTFTKEWFEHLKKSWYNEGYIDGKYNRPKQI